MTDQVVNDQIETVTDPVTDPVNETPTDSVETSFIDSITDEELKGSKSLANFKDINGLAKSYVNLEKKLGAPKEQETYTEDQYNYEAPEGLEVNNDMISPLRAKALELGVKPEAFKGLIETYLQQESSLINDQSQGLETATSDLKKEWGNAYDEKLKNSFNTWNSYAGEENKGMIEELSPKHQLVIAKIMDNISGRVGEGSVGKPSINILTKETAQSKLDDIYSNQDHPYWSGDANARQEVFSLQKRVTQ